MLRQFDRALPMIKEALHLFLFKNEYTDQHFKHGNLTLPKYQDL